MYCWGGRASVRVQADFSGAEPRARGTPCCKGIPPPCCRGIPPPCCRRSYRCPPAMQQGSYILAHNTLSYLTAGQLHLGPQHRVLPDCRPASSWPTSTSPTRCALTRYPVRLWWTMHVSPQHVLYDSMSCHSRFHAVASSQAMAPCRLIPEDDHARAVPMSVWHQSLLLSIPSTPCLHPTAHLLNQRP